MAEPGTAPQRESARHPAFVRVTHWITALCFFALLVSGVEIVISHPRFYWGETGNVLTPAAFTIPIPASRASVPTGYGFVLPDQNGWSRALHFQSAWIVALAGVLYVILGLFTGHIHKRLMTGLSWRALSSTIADHLRLRRPAADYNPLQRIAYLSVIFILFPLTIWTGLAMSPAVVSAFPALVTLLGGQQSARTLHFGAAVLLTGFLAVHIAMVVLAGFRKRIGAMIVEPQAAQSVNVSRRALIATAAGASGVAVAAAAASRYGLVPPDYPGIYGLGATLTYGSHRVLTRNSLAREFPRERITTPFANGHVPDDDEYRRLQSEGFAGWRLAVDGLVNKPAAFSLADLKRFPAHSQITQLACEEGWSFIAEWTGVPLAEILNAVEMRPEARYVVYFSAQPGWWDSVDMADALHPQTLLTYGMNGGELPAGHGGPLRLRIPRQLGYKSVKYINRITVAGDLKAFGAGLGSGAPEAGYSWYAGI